METITAPVPFLEAMGNIALDARLMVLQLMPFLIILIFFWGYVSYLLGMSGNKINLNRFVFTPLFLFILLRFYPTVIDVTGNAYGIVINTFDKPEYKEFHLKYLGVQEELNAYGNIAQNELKNYKQLLEKEKTAADEKAEGSGWWFWKKEADPDPAVRAANAAVSKEIAKKLKEAEELHYNVVESALFSIWDFFSLPTIRIIRYVIDVVRNVFLSLLVIFGSFAIFFECIPAFKGILNKWFKFYTAVTFWALTVCVLDGMFLAFAEAGVSSAKHFHENAAVVGAFKDIQSVVDLETASAFSPTPNTIEKTVEVTDFAMKWYSYGGSEGLNKAVSVVMVLSYCMVPFITSLYIGGEAAGMFMSKAVGVGSMAVRQGMSTATNTVANLGRAAGGTQRGEQARLAANVASIATAMNSGKS
jgi:hypothetical protein